MCKYIIKIRYEMLQFSPRFVFKEGNTWKDLYNITRFFLKRTCIKSKGANSFRPTRTRLVMKSEKTWRDSSKKAARKRCLSTSSEKQPVVRATSPANLQRTTIIEGIDGKWKGKEAQMMCFNTDDP